MGIRYLNKFLRTECSPENIKFINIRELSGKKNHCINRHDINLNSMQSVATIVDLTKKPIYPSEKEIKKNVRSRSAKLRVARKI